VSLFRVLVGAGVRAAMRERRRDVIVRSPGPAPLPIPAPPPGPGYAPGALPPPGGLLPMPPPRGQISHALAITLGIGGTLAIGIGIVMIALQAMVSSVDVDAARWERLAAGVVGNTLVCVVPGLLLYAVTGWLVWRARRLARLQALCDTHARLPIATLAQHLGTTDDVASALVLDAVERKLVFARLDLEPGMILSGNAVAGAGRQWAGQCKTCMAQASVVLAPGQPGICPYCRGALGVTG
jgi:hypothetical protein